VLSISVCAIVAIVAARTGSALGAFALSMLSTAIAGIATLAFFALFSAMLIDLKGFTRDPDFHWWFVLIPGYNSYWILTVVRDQVRKARAAAGLSPELRSGVLYFVLPAWALAVDIDELSEP
jgi:hypothetical protein